MYSGHQQKAKTRRVVIGDHGKLVELEVLGGVLFPGTNNSHLLATTSRRHSPAVLEKRIEEGLGDLCDDGTAETF